MHPQYRTVLFVNWEDCEALAFGIGWAYLKWLNQETLVLRQAEQS